MVKVTTKSTHEILTTKALHRMLKVPQHIYVKNALFHKSIYP